METNEELKERLDLLKQIETQLTRIEQKWKKLPKYEDFSGYAGAVSCYHTDLDLFINYWSQLPKPDEFQVMAKELGTLSIALEQANGNWKKVPSLDEVQAYAKSHVELVERQI